MSRYRTLRIRSSALPFLGLWAAVVPLHAQVTDPTPASCFVEDAKLEAAVGVDYEHLGASGGISGDVAVLGAPGVFALALRPGRARVFHADGERWVEEVPLQARDPYPEDQFGAAIAMSGDRLVVGAPGNDHLCPTNPSCNSGAAYVFLRTPGGYEFEARLVASDAGSGDQFGQAVAIDGDRIVVGSPSDAQSGVHNGSAYVFERTGSNWIESAKLIGDDPLIGRFGSGVAASGDRLAVGATGLGSQGPEAAYVFVKRTLGWVQEAHLTASDAQPDDEFGSVALDGDTLLVGAPKNDDACPSSQLCQSGSAYVFERSGGSWGEVAKLTADNASANGFFGVAVALKDGVALVGAPSITSAGNKTGWVHVYRRSLGAWLLEDRIQGSGVGVGSNFGSSVALDRSRILAGNRGDSTQAPAAGSGFVFRRLLTPQAYCSAKQTSQGCLPSIGWKGEPTLTGPDDFEVTAIGALAGVLGVLVISNSGSASEPFGGGTLCLAKPLEMSGVDLAGGAGPCGGTFSFTLSQADMAGIGLTAGSKLGAQIWFRDPGIPPPDSIGLTDAIELWICP